MMMMMMTNNTTAHSSSLLLLFLTLLLFLLQLTDRSLLGVITAGTTAGQQCFDFETLRKNANPVGIAKSNGKQQAFVGMITSRSLLVGAQVWAKSVRMTNSKPPNTDIVLLVPPDIVDDVKFDPLFDHVRAVENLPNPYNRAGFNKFYIWTMTNYDKIVYMDVDMLVKENIADLFDRIDGDNDFAAVPDVSNADFFNSGLMVIRPSLATYYHLVFSLLRFRSYNRSDQGFFNAVFSRWFSLPSSSRIPFTYNAITCTLPLIVIVVVVVLCGFD